MAKKAAIWQDITMGSTLLAASVDSKAAPNGTPFDALRLSRNQVSRKSSKETNSEDCNDDHHLDTRNPEGDNHKLSSLNTNQQKRRESTSLDCCQDDTKENDPTDIIDSSNLNPTSAVAFTISLGDASSRKPPPKKLRNQAHGRKQVGIWSAESIREKLEMAEMRRKQQEEARLRRIHSRQEEARKLAHNVEILLEQRALAMRNMASGGAENKMSSRELLATAQQVACNFNSLTHKMKSDFAINDKCTRANVKPNSSQLRGHHSGKSSCDQNQNVSSKTTATKATSPSPTKGGIAFTVTFKENDDAVENSVCHKLKSPVKLKARANLTVRDIEEKQRKAEERRNTRRKERVKRVVANREATFRFASNLETFLSVQDSDNVSSRREAAKLADEIADTFDRMSQKYSNVLKQAEGFPCQTLFVYNPDTGGS